MNILQKKPHLILASKSPRRRYLLKQAGLQFDVVPSDFDESSVSLTKPEAYVKILSEKKVAGVAADHPQSWVIGADTVVVINDNILGKPKSDAEARQMLRQLSDATHTVLSGYSIQCRAQKRVITDVAATQVHFKGLSEEEITWYIDTREPFDKAGAYAIQGLGTFIVKHINGSYTNVVGLPVCEVIEILLEVGALNRSRETIRP